MSEHVISRFAPSPTGRLHLGHLWSALKAHDLARAAGGTFLVRIEDIDTARCRPQHVAAILADLEWLGLVPDASPLFQSTRMALYAAAIERLQAMALLYPCFCTRAEIAASLSAPHGPEGAIYPGTCRAMPADRRAQRLANEAHCWRIDMVAAVARAGPLKWHDVFAGSVIADPARFGDVVLARKDVAASYHLAVTIDDAAQQVSDVVRGADLFAATDVHRLLQALLDLPTPRYHHHRLIVDGNGQRLAKRAGSPGVDALREAGFSGEALADDLRAARFPFGFALLEP